MLQDDGPAKQQEDHYRLADVPVRACRMELESLHEWLQQEAISVKYRADLLEPMAKSSKLKLSIRAISERAHTIDLKDLQDSVKNAENAIQAIKDKKYNHVLEASSILEREMIPLRNLARELYQMRETLNLLESDEMYISFDNYDDD